MRLTCRSREAIAYRKAIDTVVISDQASAPVLTIPMKLLFAQLTASD